MKTARFGWRIWGVGDLDYTREDLELSTKLQESVKYLSKDLGIRDYIHYENLEKSADFIERTFRDLGYRLEIMRYDVNGRVFKNIIAEILSLEPAAETVIIGAHYDTCSNPGADDNASGVAVLIELAEQLKNIELGVNLRFIAFVNEEPPFFMTDEMGSRVYTHRLKEKKEGVKAAIILESIGYYTDKPNSQAYPPPLGIFYPNKGNFITLVSNFSSKKILKSVASAFRKASELPLETFIGPTFVAGVTFSDHWSFWQENYPAIMVTDTAFLRNPNYHIQSDLYDTLDYKRMALAVKGLKAAIIDLAKRRD